MSSILINIAYVYGAAYVTKQAINYGVYYSALYAKNFVVNKAYSWYYPEEREREQNLNVIVMPA
jgi:hypothetical protein